MEICKIKSIKKLGKLGKRYDIEVEDTHNFFANGILVHNSNFRCGYVLISGNFFQKTLKKIKNIINRNKYPEYEFLVGSHNVQLDNNKNNVYHQIAEKYDLKSKLEPGQIIYGEIYGDGIQKNYNYGLNNEIRFAAFDMLLSGRWLNYKLAYNFFRNKEIPEALILYQGEFKPELIEKYCSGPSNLCKTQKHIEGIVIKSVDEEIGHMGRMIFKYLNPEYLLLKNNTEFH